MNANNKGTPLVDKTKSLAAYYCEALDDLSSGYSLSDIFVKKQAKQFIQKCFDEESKNTKIKKCISIITDFRAIHTVSAFLLGLTIRNYLQIDTRNWRRLPGDKSSKGSFKLFWSLICLFHDIGYKYELDTKAYSTCKSVDDLIVALNLNYNYLEESEHSGLIRNYYKKRITGSYACIDHGIVGALLLYDALMDLSESELVYSSIKEHKSFFVKICDTIALHNMWRATPNSVDDYIRFDLQELIPDSDQHHMIFYKDNPLLFLLALVDTIDPIKAFCRDNRFRNPVTEESVLYSTHINFINRVKMKTINIYSNNVSFGEYANTLCDPQSGMMSWLGVFVKHTVKPLDEEVLSISINLTHYSANMDTP